MNQQEIDQALSNLTAGKEPIEVRDVQFRQLSPDLEPVSVASSTSAEVPQQLQHLMDVSLTISIELGRTTILVKDLLGLRLGAIIELDKMAGEAIDIFVNDKKFAEGEVVVIDENFGVRITKLIGQEQK